MKKIGILFTAISFLFVPLLVSSCQKAAEASKLSLVGPTNITMDANGSSSSFFFTANKKWEASWSESWLSVSPVSGSASDGPITLTIRSRANTTYDERSAVVTIKMEELSQSFLVKQDANVGIVLPDKSYKLSAETKRLEIPVQSNIQYSVSVSEDWIQHTETKGLTSSTLVFSLEENTSFDTRSATITLRPQQSGIPDQVISVQQAQKDALIVEQSHYDMPYGGGAIEVKVEANIDFDVSSNVDWIQYVETRALSSSTVHLNIDENKTNSSRDGSVEITQKNGTLSQKVYVNQAGYIAVTSLELDKKYLTLVAGDKGALNLTINPQNATDKIITWKSNNPDIASVDSEGNITAIKKGNATITASTGSISTACNVFVKAAHYPTPTAAVDLGLSVVWSKCNLDATSPSDAGGYYLWGDPSGKGTIGVFNPPSINNICNTQYDIAQAMLGKGWRLPTREEIQELFSFCSWETVSGGVRLTGPNGNIITLPLTGMGLPADGAIGSYSLMSKTYGFLMSGESYVNSGGRFVFVFNYNQSFSTSQPSYNAQFAIFPVRPVFESMDGTIPVSSISLSTESVTMSTGESYTLTATIKPDDATNKKVNWTSSDNTVATVDQNGVVSAISNGTTTITATAKGGSGVSASCAVRVKEPYTAVAGEAVDLGLSVKWSSTNLGATSPSDYGDYFSWGETSPKDNYSWETYELCNGQSFTLTKYNNSSSYGAVDNKSEFKDYGYKDDAARQALGGKWRMPTDAEWTELRTKCTWTWTTNYNGTGVKGRIVTATNGNSIFLPAAGYRSDSDLYYAGSDGFYWSSSLITDYPNGAWRGHFDSGSVYRGGNNRYCGESVRPVSE